MIQRQENKTRTKRKEQQNNRNSLWEVFIDEDFQAAILNVFREPKESMLKEVVCDAVTPQREKIKKEKLCSRNKQKSRSWKYNERKEEFSRVLNSRFELGEEGVRKLEDLSLSLSIYLPTYLPTYINLKNKEKKDEEKKKNEELQGNVGCLQASSLRVEGVRARELREKETGKMVEGKLVWWRTLIHTSKNLSQLRDRHP